MIPLTPGMLKLGAVAIATAVLAGSCYIAGRKAVRGEMDALKRSYEVAAAQAAGREAERSRMWQTAAKVAGERYGTAIKQTDASFDASLDRLRNAYQGSAGLRAPTSVTGGCQDAGGPTAADVLGAGEALAGILRDADRTDAALRACVAAFPQ